MFGPEYTAGCPVCSSGADTFDGAVEHLKAHDVTFRCVWRGPLERLRTYKARMGWSFPWVSSAGTDFHFAFDVSHTGEQVAEGDPPEMWIRRHDEYRSSRKRSSGSRTTGSGGLYG